MLSASSSASPVAHGRLVAQPGRGSGLLAWLLARLDLAQYRPQSVSPVIESHLTGREGDYIVIKNPETKTYFRLGQRDYFLWQRMDGDQTVRDLVVAYFMQFGAFAFARVAVLVASLKASQFLADRPVNVYQQARSQLERRQPGYLISQLWHAFLQKQFAIDGLDGVVGALYRRGGWLLFIWPLQMFFLLVSIAGMIAFVPLFTAGAYGLFNAGGSLAAGVALLLLANLISIFLHELSHALTVKHYGREVRRAGFMLYFGLPAFFVDTTDIWLSDKRARLAVTWAGPHSGLILGGLASLIMTLWPSFALNPFLFQFAFLCYLTVFVNLNPLLELDGYYLLMDWLEIPMLRRRSLDFIRSGLAEKVRQFRAETQRRLAIPPLAAFSREERIFTVFGFLSALWTAYAVYVGVSFWQSRLTSSVTTLWSQREDVGRFALALAGIAISLPFVLAIGLSVISYARRGVHWLARRGLFDSTWNVAGLLALAALGLAWLPRLVALPPVVEPLLALAVLAVATACAVANARAYAGSRLGPVFWLFAAAAAAFFGREAVEAAGILGWAANGLALLPLAYVFTLLALVALPLACALLFANTDLAALGRGGKALLGLGVAAIYGLVVVLLTRQQGTVLTLPETLVIVAAALAPLLSLLLLAPTVTSAWRTSIGPAWLLLALASAGLLAAGLALAPLMLSYGLLASGLYLHRQALGRAARVQEPLAPAPAIGDAERLARAFDWMARGVFHHFREIAGSRQAAGLAATFNNYALAAGWRLALVTGEVEDTLPAELTLIERGRAYASALAALLDLADQELGDKLTGRALQRAYDHLPWEEREVAAQYLLPHVPRAAVLGQEFHDTRRSYASLLRQMPLFSAMSDAEIELLLTRLKPGFHRAGEYIIREGERGDRFYIIEQGYVEVTQRDERGVMHVLNQLRRGDYFGEIALLRDTARTATCRAVVPSHTLSLSRADFDSLVRQRFELHDKVDQAVARANLLRQIPLFAEMDGSQIELLAAALRPDLVEPGQVIIRQGDAGDTFYVIEAGRVEAFVTEGGQERVLRQMGAGEYFGEIALLLHTPRTASVRAQAPTRLLAMRRVDFDRLVAEQLSASRLLARESTRRLRAG